MQTFNASSIDGYTVRRETFRDRTHIVVPVTILTEGVHAGSNGAVYYPPEELSKHTAAWDGVPVTLGHPQTEDGFVSANSPKVLEDWALGQLFNTKWNTTKKALQSECWIDESVVQNKAPELLGRLEKGDHIEVSTGLFFDADEAEGVWNGEGYKVTAKHYRPNHLAILPDSRGACSCADGCGIRANQSKEGPMSLVDKIKELIWPSVVANSEGSLEDYSRKLSELVSGLNKPGGGTAAPVADSKWHMLEATYPDEGYCVICQHGPEGMKYFLVDYEEDDEGMPSKLADTMTEAIRKIEYEPITEAAKPVPTGNASCKSGAGTHMEDDDKGMDPKVKAAKRAREAMRKMAGNA